MYLLSFLSLWFYILEFDIGIGFGLDYVNAKFTTVDDF